MRKTISSTLALAIIFSGVSSPIFAKSLSAEQIAPMGKIFVSDVMHKEKSKSRKRNNKKNRRPAETSPVEVRPEPNRFTNETSATTGPVPEGAYVDQGEIALPSR